MHNAGPIRCKRAKNILFLFFETYLKTVDRWFGHIEHQWSALLLRMWEVLAFGYRLHHTAQSYITVTKDFTFLPVLHS